VWTDYQFLDENYEVINPDLADKNLILIGGPVVNRAVDYLNDTGKLWIVYVGDRLYDMRFYHDGVYEDEGYVDLERVRTWIGAHTVSFVGGLGVIQYAKEDPWGEEENYILVVAGNNRYGTYAAAVALADPTKVVRVPEDIPTYYYLAGTDEEHPPALIVVALLPGVAPPAPWVPPEHNNIVEITWPTPITVEPVISPGG
ncbi:MAG: S-layer protein, partial [Candidatus Korarchaeota archaeon]|nr:S-layer protein [Candidatus Korarchaeota archaeon]